MNYTVFFSNLWMKLFGTTEFLGVNIGFWFGMAVVALFVIIENCVFWGIRPERKQKQ